MARPGKDIDALDFGDYQDYSNHEWFKEPARPPRTTAAPATADREYVPTPQVVSFNEELRKGFTVAPYECWKQYKYYGQIGVLAWCHEFSEMIDSLKSFTLEGHLFVPTRTQALQACDDLLALDIEVGMRLIQMYFATQINRIRDFLDPNTKYNDYPPNWPIRFPDTTL